MNKKFKLLALLATLTTVAVVPISNLVNGKVNEPQISKNSSQESKQTTKFQANTPLVDYASDSQAQFNIDASPFLDQFVFFLKSNMYFIDLTSAYGNQATPAQKAAIEKIALWIGKGSDYSFSPMTIQELTDAATANFPESITQKELTTTMDDFIAIQAVVAKTLINSTYAKWIQTMEGTTDGHQWGWYNQDSLPNMLPAYTIDSENGLTYNVQDNDIMKPATGLQNLLAKFHENLQAGTPERFIDQYLNPVSGGAVEAALHQYQTLGKNQLSYYVQKILDEYNKFYYGFSDTDPQKQQFWNYYLDDTTLSPLTSVDEVVAKWTNVMKDSSWNGKTAINFFIASDVWDDISTDIIAGKDANVEKYEFTPTTDFSNFEITNKETFDVAVGNLYNVFLSKNYFGYADPNNVFDVSGYYSGTPLQIKTLDQVKASFTHTTATYTELSKYFTWTPNGIVYKISETKDYLAYIFYQRTALEQDFQILIDNVSSSYYGFDNLTNNRLTTYVFAGLQPGTEMNADTLVEYFVLNHPATSDEYLGVWSTKSMLDSLKNNPNMGSADWINDQKTKLNNRLQEIIDQVKDGYYGWITATPEPGTFVTNIDRLLANFPPATELTPEAIAATISSTSLPTGLTGLYQVAGFLKLVSSADITTFKDNQSVYLLQEISRIVPLVESTYFGYESTPELGPNSIYQVILYSHMTNSPIDVQNVFTSFKQGLANGVEAFPKPYLVRQFLGNINNENTDFKAFVQDQRNQVIDHFTNIITIIEPYYYGFERLANNPVSDYILLGYTDGTPLDPVVLANYLMDNFPTSPSVYLPGKWYLNGFLSTLISDKTLINEFLADQSNSLQNAWNPLYDEMVNNYYGYTTEMDSLVSRTFLIIQNDGTPLDSAALLKLFKQNVIDMHGTQDFPFPYAVKVWLETIVSENKISGEFGNEQKTALSYDVEQSIRQYNNAFWGYNDDITLPNYFIQYFLSSDRKTPLSNAQVVSNVIEAAKQWGFYKIYEFFNSGISGGVFYDLFIFSQSQEIAAKGDLRNILELLVQSYNDKDFNYTQSPSPFEGANHIWALFMCKNGSTYGLESNVDGLYTLFKSQIAQTDLINRTTHYSVLAQYLASLYVNDKGTLSAAGELLNWKEWEGQ